MNGLLMGLLERTIAALLVRLAEIDLNQVKDEVLKLWNADMQGEQKRALALERLRMIGAKGAAWVINAAIEIVVGKLKREQA